MRSIFLASFIFLKASWILLGVTSEEVATCLSNDSRNDCVSAAKPTDGHRLTVPSLGENTTGDNEDRHKNCHFWGNHGECEINPNYMLKNCVKTCRSLTVEAPEPWEGDSEVVAGVERKLVSYQDDDDEDEEDDDEVFSELSFGVEQSLEGEQKEKIRETIFAAIDYMEKVVLANSDNYSQEFVDACRNKDRLCAFWASIGECDDNPGYMKINCAPVCQTCDYIDMKKRCPLDPNAKDALEPGDLHRMFEQIIEDSSERYNITTLSRPYIEDNEGIYGIPLEEGQIDGPWVITFENFLTDEEADRMVKFGYDEGYERSTDVGAVKIDGTYEALESSGRTSTNAWCQGECNEDEMTQAVWKRMEEVTGISQLNSEHFQILRYEPGQYYKVHHDFIEMDVGKPSGPRILTFFLYLSDVEEGGGTNFPRLGDGDGLIVMPKKGKALLWSSVLDESPEEWDARTHHASLPVEKGLKFAANAWIHMRDFKTPHEVGCA